MEAAPPQVSPFARFRACARNESDPAVLLASVRTVNEPLAPCVVFVPRKIRLPFSKSLTRQCWPTLFESTSYSTSILPSSGESLSFQSLEPLHEPRRMTSLPPLATALVVPASVNSSTPAIATLIKRPTMSIPPLPLPVSPAPAKRFAGGRSQSQRDNGPGTSRRGCSHGGQPKATEPEQTSPVARLNP